MLETSKGMFKLIVYGMASSYFKFRLLWVPGYSEFAGNCRTLQDELTRSVS